MPEHLWSIKDIAGALDQKHVTVAAWWYRKNGRLPEADYTLNGKPGWRKKTLKPLLEALRSTVSDD